MLGLLVVVSVVLLTAYFGASASSPLHGVQRGIVAVLTPIESGASTVLSPVRNVSDWVSSTLRAKSEVDQLKRENANLTSQLAVAQQQAIDNRQLTRQVGLDQSIGAANYHPVGAAVINRGPSLWFQQVEVNAGSSRGVALGQPVLADGALVGKVTEVTGASSIVQLITDHTMSVASEVQNHVGDTGVLSPDVGSPNRLLLQDLPRRAAISSGELVVTAGYRDPTNPSQPGSLYPPGIPIGRVVSFSQNELLNSGQVSVAPLASLRTFTSVQILTKPYAGTAQARVP